MSAVLSRPLRIDDVAARAGTTTGTIRAYEELGLLPRAGARCNGAPNSYGEADVERATAILRLTKLIGLTPETVRGMLEAEHELRIVQKRCEGTADTEAQAGLAAEALGHVERQLKLTRERRHQLDGFEQKLWTRRNRLQRLLIRRRREAQSAQAG